MFGAHNTWQQISDFQLQTITFTECENKIHTIRSHDVPVDGVEITALKASRIVKNMTNDCHKIFFVRKSWVATRDPGPASGDETGVSSGLYNIRAFV